MLLEGRALQEARGSDKIQRKTNRWEQGVEEVVWVDTGEVQSRYWRVSGSEGNYH